MTLKGFTNLGDSTLTNDIRENLISYFDYNLLQQGNLVTVPVPSTGMYGGIDSRLRLVDDPRYDSGQVWATFHPNLVWESGAISGVYVGNTLYPPTTTGTYAHHIDYPNGVVRFDTAIPTGSVVDLPYSYKYVTVTQADGLPWFEELQSRVRSDGDFAVGSGQYEVLPENRLALPVIGIEGGTRSSEPYQLGGGRKIYTTFYCHCVAEDGYMRDNLTDILTYQAAQSFKMYDLNAIGEADAFPLDYKGVPNSGALTFPQLVSTYGGRTIYIKDAVLDSSYTLGRLQIGTVKLTTEVIHFGV